MSKYRLSDVHIGSTKASANNRLQRTALLAAAEPERYAPFFWYSSLFECHRF